MEENEIQFHFNEDKQPSLQVKFLANEFYKSLTNSMREYVLESQADKNSTQSIRHAYNVWTLMRCFWFSFKYSSKINAKDRVEMDGDVKKIDTRKREVLYNEDNEKEKIKGVLSEAFADHTQAFVAMDKLFEKAGKAGIFIDYSSVMGDYDSERIERNV